MKLIRIPWADVKKELKPWINAFQGEPAVITYLLRHPELVEEAVGIDGLELAGVEVAIPPAEPEKKGRPRRADIIYLKNGHYVVVEAKDGYNAEENGVKDAEFYCNLLKSHLDKNGYKYSGITPVAAYIEYPRGAKYGWLIGSSLDRT